ncbi:S8/S53 family peptidase [Polymorphum gilvum]|uniref:Peptidase S8 and S53 subtilisin kexin sedolisin n=1 Tax=Polymorphum gilvum (strain LMG 25793 / CGMCC 1.9160 / SL003B-26A1) TaxID=991905 RepID=F2J2J4_POLGS|nr:S8/S53 family peptidase [Polymorphum gilvum]ADZ70908.1 hypothetical protein SL003B_2484 [Polymorphum gilvum SL003B-26A1]
MIRLALLDGALAADASGLAAQAWFCRDDGSAAARRHAGALSATIRHFSGAVRVVNAVVFPGRLSTTVEALADALDWLREEPPQIVHCSFGLARPSAEIALRIRILQEAGSLVVASAPARGGPVFPAALADVVSVQGDARCGPGELSRLDLPQAAWGACPVALGHPQVRGASAAAAHLSGLLAARWSGSAAEALDALSPAVRYLGRERCGA